MFQVQHYASSFFIGETSQGIESAVFYDPSFASFNNVSPVSLITGAPGSGKTFLAQTLCAQSAISGKMTVVIDPKADFISMKEIEQDVGDVTLLQLSSNGRRGIIDPFVICGNDMTYGISLAKEIIKIFTGLKDLPVEAIDPIIRDVAAEDNPSLTTVMQRLLGFNKKGNPQQSDRVRNIGMMLKTLSEMPFARLAFSNPYKVPQRVPLRDGLTVITMLGLRLPNANKPREEYTTQENLASGLIFLVTDYAYRVMSDTDSSIPKMMFIDEAWSMIKNPAGAEVISNVSLLGRSLNMSLVMATQSASHLSGVQDAESSITTFFAFRTNGKEGNRISELMGLRNPTDEDDDSRFINLMSNLNVGECLMKDVRQRYATVQVSRYKKDWAEVFETNPETKAQRENQKQSDRNSSSSDQG